MTRVQKKLEDEGYRFSFFKAIHLLETLYKERPGVGHLGPFGQEIVRILPNQELSFPPADIARTEVATTEKGEEKWSLFENFLGLYGPNAATPMYIAEMIAQCPGDEDPLRDFLDIFNHRVLSLYYRAWKKHNLSASVSSAGDDAFTTILFAMIGCDCGTLTADWRIEPFRLLRYAGYFCSISRPACALENLISDFFRLGEVDVVQFVPRRYVIPESAVSRLSNFNDGGRLGESFVLGDTITDVAGQFKIRLGSLSMDQFLSFQPGEPQYEELVFLSNMYVKHQLGLSLELVLKPNQGGSMKLSSIDPIGVLGRSAWLGYPSEEETTVVFEVADDT
jgi:type VI secretion system protein ImpH